MYTNYAVSQLKKKLIRFIELKMLSTCSALPKTNYTLSHSISFDDKVILSTYKDNVI